MNASVACEDPTSWVPHAWTGFSTDENECSHGLTPCDANSPDGVDPAATPFEWSISATPSDPHATMSETPAGVFSLYLWLTCSFPVDWHAAEFSLEGSLLPVAFNAADGFMNWGNESDLILTTPGCVSFPRLVGEIRVRARTAVEDEDWGRIKALYR